MGDKVDAAAVAFVIQHEKKRGVHYVKSVEDDDVGYDLESYDKEGILLRAIEVKGKTSDHDGEITPNEWKVAERLRDDYWLYVVDDAIDNPRLFKVQDPFGKIKAKADYGIRRWFFEMGEIRLVGGSI